MEYPYAFYAPVNTGVPSGLDLNGRRNHDEIRFGRTTSAPRRSRPTSTTTRGARRAGARGTVRDRGRLQRRPARRRLPRPAIDQLLDLPQVNTTVTPSSEGGAEQAALQGGVNLEHLDDPALDTADFGEPPGNIRVDYVLPSRSLQIEEAQVFWPVEADPLFRLVGTYPFPTSDHRLVQVDVRLPHHR